MSEMTPPKYQELGPSDVIQAGDKWSDLSIENWLPIHQIQVGRLVSDYHSYKFRRPIPGSEEKVPDWKKCKECGAELTDGGIMVCPFGCPPIQPTAASEEGKEAAMLEIRANTAENCLRAFTKLCLDALGIAPPASDRDRAKLILDGIQSLTRKVEELEREKQSINDSAKESVAVLEHERDSLRAENAELRSTIHGLHLVRDCLRAELHTYKDANTRGEAANQTLKAELEQVRGERARFDAQINAKVDYTCCFFCGETIALRSLPADERRVIAGKHALNCKDHPAKKAMDSLQSRLDAAEKEIRAVLDTTKGAIQVREGGGDENIYASLAVTVAAIANQRDATAAELLAERELRIMQLAAISTASIQNTEASKADRIDGENPFWSAAYGDTCAAVDREIALRDELKKAREALVGALKDLTDEEGACPVCGGVHPNGQPHFEHAFDCWVGLAQSAIKEVGK